MKTFTAIIVATLAIAAIAVIDTKPTRAQLAKITVVRKELMTIINNSFGNIPDSQLFTNCLYNNGKLYTHIPAGDFFCDIRFIPQKSGFNSSAAINKMFKSIPKLGMKTNYSSSNHCNDKEKNQTLIAQGGAECTLFFFPSRK